MSTYSQMIYSVTVKYSDKINSASKKFCEYFNLVQFWYNRVDDDGTVMTLSNHAEWTEFFAAEALYQKCPLLRKSQYLKEGITILNDFQEGSGMNQILMKGKSKFDMNVWIALVYKTKAGTEQFGFCTKRVGLTLFFNELPLIHFFAKQFCESNQFVLSKLKDNKINIIDLIGDSFYTNSNSFNGSEIDRADLLNTLGIRGDIHLSEKEMKAVHLTLQGFSASEIAPQIFLAKRSVEHLLERVKEKLLCSSKKELIQKAQELEILGFFNHDPINYKNRSVI